MNSGSSTDSSAATGSIDRHGLEPDAQQRRRLRGVVLARATGEAGRQSNAADAGSAKRIDGNRRRQR